LQNQNESETNSGNSKDLTAEESKSSCCGNEVPQQSKQGNYRLYTEDYIDRLKFIVNCRSLNMNLIEIKKLLNYKDLPNLNCSDVNELIDSHINDVEENIRNQQKLIQQLLEIRKTCDGLCTVDKCGVLKKLA